MKFIIAISAVCFLLLGNCSQVTAPADEPTLGPGEYAGTFSVTFKQYRNSQSPVMQSGGIRISFSDSTYNYEALVTHSSDSTAIDSLGDSGTYTLETPNISMDDIAWRRMGPAWYPSLYFKNTFTYQVVDKQIKISQENSFARWELNLVQQ